ncbi:putative RNA-binding protein [Desulfocapsa sulfexigens DSM 10523]|uniref:RNA-binding protein KhpB n=1 Tax=Desulfocapsa sulfexigens (strain DSM 10523 / SB164P1) TaxID=1167006 RepID=M1P491_DESSD|nr:Jag N-terminal domain-containing protein [Desulfocapsa sulfexigens]AGF78308.1 putative RNA-binding protein [Desulfocapsa sulfexigens DSM 10523]
MSAAKIDFYGKEVTDAIEKACDTLRVPQEELDIEVVETGSLGIFGLIRKKAHIRAVVKGLGIISDAGVQEEKHEVSAPVKPSRAKAKVKAQKTAAPEKVTVAAETNENETIVEAVAKEEVKKQSAPEKTPVEIQPESVEFVRLQLEELLKLMAFPSEVTAELEDGTIRCQVGDEYEEALTGQDGKIIDSLQYLLRKLAARHVEEKIHLSIDVGEFREKRKVELMERAKELAALVKEDGKTQAIPPLNPSERRIVHVALQEDKDIRSRSVGDGLFKKILIYKPGKGKPPGTGKRGGRGRRGKAGSGQKPQESNDS